MKLSSRLVGHRPALQPDPEIIRSLAGLLAETGLSEIEYAIGDHRIRVSREATGKTAAAANGNGHAHVPAAPPSAAVAAPETTGAVHPGTLTSPMVGVAYLAPEPGAAPFVRVGEQVTKGQTLLIIEAMKVMNQIRAPRDGRVTQIHIEDAEPVEYGAPLMLIE